MEAGIKFRQISYQVERERADVVHVELRGSLEMDVKNVICRKVALGADRANGNLATNASMLSGEFNY